MLGEACGELGGQDWVQGGTGGEDGRIGCGEVWGGWNGRIGGVEVHGAAGRAGSGAGKCMERLGGWDWVCGGMRGDRVCEYGWGSWEGRVGCMEARGAAGRLGSGTWRRTG